MPTTVRLDETGRPTNLHEATPGTRRRRVLIISPGQGSSGYYPADVLERDGPRVIRAGTHMYVDHPGRDEEADRPERTIRDLAGVLDSDAVWDPQGSDGPGLYAEASIRAGMVDLIDELADHIGTSIRGAGEVDDEGTITALTHVESVDYVTRAGRGGRVLEILESARPVAEALTANELRDALAAAARDRWGDDDTPAWVRDYSTDEGWAAVEVDFDTLYKVSFTVTDDEATLGDDAVEVRADTTYVPVGDVTEALREAAAALAEARNVGQWFESLIHLDFTRRADEMAADGRLTRDERIALSSAIGDGLQSFVDALEDSAPHLYDRDIYDDPDPAPSRMEETDMPRNDTDTARIDALESQVATLTDERDTAIAERDEARTEADGLRESARTAQARTIVTDALAHVDLPDAVRDDVIDTRTREATTGDDDLDPAAIRESIHERYGAPAGATVTGLGEARTPASDDGETDHTAGLSENASRLFDVKAS